MVGTRKVVVVMPAYNAAETLERTYAETMAQGVVDQVVIVDDASEDETVKRARALPGAKLFVHESNRGYGANQKSCYRLALAEGADIVVMVHPDYQYTPKLIPAMATMIGSGLFDLVLGSRILGGQAMRLGMPWWRYGANRFLTLFENLMTGAKLSEYHTGYRAYSRRLLERIDCDRNSDDFVFDAQVLAQALWVGGRVGEISCPASYGDDASSIGLGSSMRYGFGVLGVSLLFRLGRMGLLEPALFAGLRDLPPPGDQPSRSAR
jgi:glycosyltransferase involved in cell wall biosynthesis